MSSACCGFKQHYQGPKKGIILDEHHISASSLHAAVKDTAKGERQVVSRL